MKRIVILSLGLLVSLPLQADAKIEICFNYGCVTRMPVVFEAQALDEIGAQVARAGDAAEEREAIALAVGALYRIAGAQSPISADRAGNLLDKGANGRMDCIDHSTSTTALLRMMAERRWLRFHEVGEPARRTRFIFQHFSAVVAEVVSPEESAENLRFAVDSWFVEHGEPAVILPLAEWLRGEGPNVQ